MTFTSRPGNVNAQPGNFIPGFGISIHRYSVTLTASISPTGSVTSIWNNVFNQLSIATYRAVSRAFQFVTQPRPLI